MQPELRVLRKGLTLATTRLGDPATIVEGRCGVEELSKVAFEVQFRQPGHEYLLTLGDDELHADADLGTVVAWREQHYFESCVGEVHLRLFAREDGTAWAERARLNVYVTPEKL